MCGLCGIFGSEDHWTAGKTDGGPSADPVVRRRARARRVHAANAVLAQRRLSVSDWQGESYQLSGPTGKTVLVDNLTEIWAALDDGFGGAFDPLCPDVIAFMAQRQILSGKSPD